METGCTVSMIHISNVSARVRTGALQDSLGRAGGPR